MTKTYKRILKHFFWPGLKKDVVSCCHTCHVCQVTGKPNQKFPPAPLVPIPIVGEPFEHVILDCVGPLPKTKAGNQFLLTIMCSATCFPRTVPLRKITAPVVIKAMIKFFYFWVTKNRTNRSGSEFSVERVQASFNFFRNQASNFKRLSS